MISLSIVVCGLIKFLYTKNKIRSGGYVNDHPKKHDAKAGKAGLAGIIGIEAWMIYYYFKRLTPEEQDIILEKAEKKAAEEKAGRETPGKRTVIAIDKSGEKD